MLTQALASATRRNVWRGPKGWKYDPNSKKAIAPDGQTYTYAGQGDPSDADLDEIIAQHKPQKLEVPAQAGALAGNAAGTIGQPILGDVGKQLLGLASPTQPATPPQDRPTTLMGAVARGGFTTPATKLMDEIIKNSPNITEAEVRKLMRVNEEEPFYVAQVAKTLKNVPTSVKASLASIPRSERQKQAESGVAQDVTGDLLLMALPDPVTKAWKLLRPILDGLAKRAGGASAKAVAEAVERVASDLNLTKAEKAELQKALPRLGETTYREAGVTAVPPGGVRAPEKAALKEAEDAYVKKNMRSALQKARTDSMRDRSLSKPKVDQKAVEKALREEYRTTQAATDAERIRKEAVAGLPRKGMTPEEIAVSRQGLGIKEPTGGLNASKVESTAQVHGDVRPSAPKVEGQVSAEVGGAGVRPNQGKGLTGQGQAQEVGASVQNAATDAQRQSVGLETLKSAKPESTKQWFDEANRRGYPNRALKIAQDVLDGKEKRLDDVKSAGIATRLSQLDEEFKSAPLSDPERIRDIADEVDILTRATRKAGTEWGREGVSRQTWFKHDYSEGGLLRRFVGESPDGNTAAVAQQAKRLGGEIAKSEADLAKAKSNAGLYVTRGQRIKGDIRQARANAISRIRENWGKGPFIPKSTNIGLGDIDNLGAIAKDLMVIVRSYVQEGAVTLAELVPKVRNYLKANEIDISDDAIHRLLAGEYEHASREITDAAKALQELRKEAKSTVGAQRTMLERRIKETEARIRTGPATPKAKASIDKSLRDLEIELMAKRVEADTIAAELRRQRLGKNVSLAAKAYQEVADITRSVVASTDLSAPFNQGIFAIGGHPIASAKAGRDMLKALKSEAEMNRLIAQTRLSKHYNEGVAAGLEVHGTRLGRGEEFFTSQLINDLPLIAHSERAYTAYLNKLRMDMFSNLVEMQEKSRFFGAVKAKKLDIEELKATAEYVNTVTGVGTGKFSSGIKQANQVLPLAFAPGYMVSRWKTLAATPLINAAVRRNPRLAVAILKDYAAFTGVLGGTLIAAEKAGLNVDSDINSGTFGKMQWGDIELDPFGSIFGPLRLANKSRKAPKAFPVHLGFYATGKASPLGRVGLDLGKGENFNKEPVGFKNWTEFWNLSKGMLPIQVQQQMELSDVKEKMESDKDFTREQQAALWLIRLATLGGLNINVKGQPAKGR